MLPDRQWLPCDLSSACRFALSLEPHGPGTRMHGHLKTLRRLTRCACLVVLAALAAMAPLVAQGQVASPSGGPPLLDWDTLESASRAIFSEFGGRQRLVAATSAESSAEQVAGPWQQLQVSTFDDIAIGPEMEHGWELTHSVQATVNLGGPTAPSRRAWQASAVEQRAWAEAEWLEFLWSLSERFEIWWASDALATHVEEHAEELSERLDTTRKSARAGWVTELDLRGLEMEVGRLRSEAAGQRREADMHRAALQHEAILPVTLVGRQGDSSPDPLDHYTPLPADSFGAFDHLATAATKAWQATAERQTSSADAARASNPWQLYFGLSNRFEGSRSGWIAGTVGLNIPLSQPGEASAVQLDGGARAAEFSATAAQHTWRARAQALLAEYQSLSTEADRIHTDWVVPSEDRLEQVEAAHRKQLVDTTTLTMAFRDAHEAHHRWVSVVAQLAARQRRLHFLSNLRLSGDHP